VSDSDRLRQELDETRYELQQALSERNRLRELVEHSPDRLRAEEAEALVVAAETSRSAADEKALELSRLLSEAVAQNHSLQRRLQTLGGDSLESVSSALETRQALERERHERAQLELRLQEAISDLEDHQLALATSEEQVLYLESEVADREDTVDSVTQQTASYLSKLRLAQEKLLTLGQAVNERNQLIRQLQEQRLSLAAKCRTWETLHDQVKGKLLESERTAEKQQEELEEVRWELQETVASLDDSTHLVSNLQDQVSSQLPSARAMIIQLQSQLRVAEAELASDRSVQDTMTDMAPVREMRSSSQT
jgi:chromosome segregation ATPase